MRRKGFNLLARGHRRAPLHAGQDDRLAYAGEGVFGPQRRSRPAEGRHARADLIGHARSVQRVHLLAVRAVNTGVAGMQAHNQPALLRRRDHDRKDFLKGHLGAVIHGAALLAPVQERGVDQRPCIDNHIGFGEQPRPAHGNQVGRARARPYKMDHVPSFTRMTEK